MGDALICPLQGEQTIRHQNTRASHGNYECLACPFRANESICLFPEGAALGYDGSDFQSVGFQEEFTWIILLTKRRIVV